jgi:hypothetical protein
MKRAIAAVAIAATAVCALWLGAAVSAQRTKSGAAAQAQWPLGLGTLDAVPQRYPPRVGSNDAARLNELAAAVQRADRQWLNRWLDAQLTRADDRVDPPPPELAQHEAALADLRAYLLGRTAIVWPTDVVAAAQAPMPNLFGLYSLTRMLIAHALVSPPTASDDLCAAWHLQRALWHRPELVSKQVALAGTRMINAAARRLEAKPEWFDELASIDYRRSILAAQQAEAWTVKKEVEDGRHDADRIIDVVLQPYDEVCAANLAAVMRRAADQMSRSRACAVSPSFDVPFWNRLGRSRQANAGAVWQRVARFQAELEATERIFALKSGAGRPTSSAPRAATDRGSTPAARCASAAKFPPRARCSTCRCCGVRASRPHRSGVPPDRDRQSPPGETPGGCGRDGRDRLEDADAVGAAEERLRAAFGVRHHAEDVALAVADAGDRARGAVRVRVAGQAAFAVAVPKDHLAIAFQLVERRVVGEVVAFSMSNGCAEDLSLGQLAGERRVRLLDADHHVAAEEPQVLIAHQRAGQQSHFRQHLEAVADAEDQPARGGVAFDRLHDRRELGQRAGAQVVAVGEAAGDDDAVGAAQVGVLVPEDLAFGAENVAHDVLRVVIAVRAGEENDAEFHFTIAGRGTL